MIIKNLTPHPFTVIQDGAPVLTLPPEETPARCREEQELLQTVDVDGVQVPIYRTSYGQVSGLPAPQTGVLYLVSQMVVAALPDRRDLVAPARIVRDERGQIVGAQGVTR